jgi:hypothetical protein
LEFIIQSTLGLNFQFWGLESLTKKFIFFIICTSNKKFQVFFHHNVKICEKIKKPIHNDILLVYVVQLGYMVLVSILILKSLLVKYDLRQYQPYTNINTRFNLYLRYTRTKSALCLIPSLDLSKSSLKVPNIITYQVWKKTPILRLVWYVQKLILVQHWFTPINMIFPSFFFLKE